MNTNHLKLQLRCLLPLTAAALIVGCAAPQKTPVYQNSLFNPTEVSRVVVAPAVDWRQDKSAKLDVNGIVQGGVKGALKGKRYEVELNKVLDTAKLTEEDLEAADAAWVKDFQAGPDCRWLMILAVHDVTRKLTFGSTGNAEISGYLFDRETGTKVWHDKGLGQAGQGGLLGMMMIGTMSQAALQGAVHNCLLSLPPKPKAKK